MTKYTKYDLTIYGPSPWKMDEHGNQSEDFPVFLLVSDNLEVRKQLQHVWCFRQFLVFSPIFGDLIDRGILVRLGFQFVASIRDQAVLEPCKALQLLGAFSMGTPSTLCDVSVKTTISRLY